MRTRRIPLIAGVLAFAVAASVLSACTPQRSVDAYCAVIAKHKERYLGSMTSAASGDPLTGIAQTITALGDLSEMWEEAAEVAPEEIRSDVEAVSDFWASQFDSVADHADNPLEALASGLLAGLVNAGALQRIDEYTASNCPGVGGMIVDGSASTPGAGQAATPSDPDMIAPEGRWAAFGPFLRVLTAARSDLALTGTTSIYVPAVGEVRLDAAALLRDEEVVEQSHLYVWDDDRPFIATAVVIRVPAAGLEPEHYVHTVLGVDVETGVARVTNRVQISEGEQERLWVVGTSQEGSVAIARQENRISGQFSAVGVDLLDQTVVWNTEGTGISGVAGADDGYVRLEEEGPAPSCMAYIRTYHGVRIATGDRVWGQDAGEAPLGGCLSFDDHPRGRFSALAQGHVPERIVFDAGTGAQIPIEGPIEHVDPLGTIASLQFENGYGTYSADLVVVDLTSGEELFRVEEERAASLKLRVEALFDGVLYVRTSDEQFVIDTSTGEQIGTWTVHPRARVGDYTWMSDDTLRRDWAYDGE